MLTLISESISFYVSQLMSKEAIEF